MLRGPASAAASGLSGRVPLSPPEAQPRGFFGSRVCGGEACPRRSARPPRPERLAVKGQHAEPTGATEERREAAFGVVERSDPLTGRQAEVPERDPTDPERSGGAQKAVPTESAPLQPPANTNRFHGPNHPGGIASPDRSQQGQAVPSLTRGTSAPHRLALVNWGDVWPASTPARGVCSHNGGLARGLAGHRVFVSATGVRFKIPVPIRCTLLSAV